MAKYYYELSKTGEETIYCAINAPIKEEKLPEIVGLPDYTARQISKEEYEQEAEQE